MFSSLAGAHVRSAKSLRGIERQCITAVLKSSAAKSLPGSASSAAVTQFSLLATPAVAADSFTSDEPLTMTLGGEGAGSFDPSDVRLLSTAGDESAYLIPASLRAAATLPAECTHIKALAGISDVLTLESDTVGSGPGLCVVTEEATKVSSTKTVDGPLDTSCASLADLDTYFGAASFMAALAPSGQEVVVPDGVTSVQLAYADGHEKTATVSHNLAVLTPTALHLTLKSPLAARRTALEAALPTSITELGSDGQAVLTLTRPADAVSLYLGQFEFGEHLLAATKTFSSGPTVTKCTAKHHCTAPTPQG